MGAQLPPAEAALYDCLTAQLDSVSAQLFMCQAGQPFSWDTAFELLQATNAAGSAPPAAVGAAHLVPLLSPVSLSGSLQLARAVHPRCVAQGGMMQGYDLHGSLLCRCMICGMLATRHTRLGVHK